MNNRAINTATIFLLIISLSCKEEFNPVGGLKQPEYVLTCVIRGDTTFQAATLYHAYENGSVENDRSVKGADIRVWYADTVFFFHEDSIYKNGKWKTVYTCSDDRFPSLNQKMEIEAVVPHIIKLFAATKTPEPIEMNFTEGEGSLPNTRGYTRFVWRSPESYVYFQPKLTLTYYIKEGEDTVKHTELIPPKINSDGKIDSAASLRLEPVYLIPGENVDYVMNKISEGDPDKSRYLIHSATLEILTLDQNLSRYAGSTFRSPDSYTIQVDETDYTNIEGGYGIFGCYRKFTFRVKVLRFYIESFGYKAIIPD